MKGDGDQNGKKALEFVSSWFWKMFSHLSKCFVTSNVINETDMLHIVMQVSHGINFLCSEMLIIPLDKMHFSKSIDIFLICPQKHMLSQGTL